MVGGGKNRVSEYCYHKALAILLKTKEIAIYKSLIHIRPIADLPGKHFSCKYDLVLAGIGPFSLIPKYFFDNF